MRTISDNLDTYLRLIKNIALQFGDGCETVLHEFRDGELYIVAICNGHVSGRSAGRISSDEFYDEYLTRDFVRNPVYYLDKVYNDKTLLSSSTPIFNDQNEMIGAICVNFDVTDLMAGAKAVDKLIHIKPDGGDHFPNDINEMLDYYLKECEALVGKAPAEMSRAEKLQALEYLDAKRVFLITRSGARVCTHFNISKYALYTYLEEIRNRQDQGQFERA